ncbi:hypothetical protein STAL104432_05405 [Streptomyces albus]
MLREALGAPLGRHQSPGGFRAGAGHQFGAVELVAAHPGAGRGEHVVGDGHGLPVSEGQPLRHPCAGVEHPAHGGAVEFACEVQQSGALGGDRPAERRDLLPQGSIFGQFRGVHLGEAAAHDETRRAVRQRLVPQRVERHHLGPRRPQQLGVLGVGEGERRAARHRHPGPAPHRLGRQLADGVPRLVRQRRRRPRKSQQRVQVAALTHPSGERGHRLDGLRTPFGDRHQAQVPGGRAHHLRAPQDAQHRHPRAFQRLPQQLLVPVGAHLVEDHPRHPHARVPGGEAVHEGRHRPGLRGGVHHQHHRGPQQFGHVRGGGQFALARGTVVEPHHPLDHGQVGTRRAVPEQRCDPLGSAQIGVQVAARTPGGQRVITGVDVVGAHLVGGDGQAPPGERRHQPGRHRRLAAPGGGRRDDQARYPDHAAPPPLGAALTIRCPSGPSGPRPWGA